MFTPGLFALRWGQCACSGRFLFPGQLDESDIGAGDDDADRLQCNEVDGDGDGFSFKDVDSSELSCKRRQRRPIFESIRAVQHLVTRQDLGTTSQVSSGGTEELGAKGEELEGKMEEYLEGKMNEDGCGKSGSEDGGTERRFWH